MPPRSPERARRRRRSRHPRWREFAVRFHALTERERVGDGRAARRRFARRVGVSVSTLYRWVDDARADGLLPAKREPTPVAVRVCAWRARQPPGSEWARRREREERKAVRARAREVIKRRGLIAALHDSDEDVRRVAELLRDARFRRPPRERGPDGRFLPR